MTQYTLKTTPTEADHICKGIKNFIFRENRYKFRAGDIVSFSVVRAGKPVRHSIDNNSFVITYVGDEGLVPVQKGFSVIGIRRIA